MIPELPEKHENGGNAIGVVASVQWWEELGLPNMSLVEGPNDRFGHGIQVTSNGDQFVALTSHHNRRAWAGPCAPKSVWSSAFSKVRRQTLRL
jgi:hypothetical protein